MNANGAMFPFPQVGNGSLSREPDKVLCVDMEWNEATQYVAKMSIVVQHHQYY